MAVRYMTEYLESATVLRSLEKAEQDIQEKCLLWENVKS